MENQVITKKRIIIGSLLIILLFVLQFVFTHSILTVKSSTDEEKTIYLSSEGQDRQFTIKDSSKTLVLPKGSYNLQVDGQNKQSVYFKKLGGFSKSTLEVSLMPQKKAIPLGASELGCSLDQESLKLVLYYPCDPSAEGPIFSTTDGTGLKQVFEPPDRENTGGSAMKPYEGGFLRINATNSTLNIQKHGGGGQPVGSPLSVGDFQGYISDTSFSVSQKGKSFVVFDDQKKSLLVFKDSADKNPARLDLSKNLYTSEGYQYKFYISDRYIYVLNTLVLDGHERDDQEEGKTKTPINQKLLVIDSSANKLVKEYELPKSSLIRRTAVGPGNNFLFWDKTGGETPYMVQADKKPKELLGLKENVSSACWKDNDSFYYVADSAKTIYLFSTSKQVSQLVYKNDGAEIVTASCPFGKLHFSITDPQDTNKLQHMVLSDQEQVGNRPEFIFPVYLVEPVDIKSATLFKNTVLVRMFDGELYENRNNPNYKPVNLIQPSNQAKQRVVDYFKSKGIETDKLNFIFSF